MKRINEDGTMSEYIPGGVVEGIAHEREDLPSGETTLTGEQFLKLFDKMDEQFQCDGVWSDPTKPTPLADRDPAQVNTSLRINAALKKERIASRGY